MIIKGCLEWCSINNGWVTLEMLVNRENEETAVQTLDTKSKGINYRLEYAPVGNNVQEPTVIIFGITPGNSTWRMLLSDIRKW